MKNGLQRWLIGGALTLAAWTGGAQAAIPVYGFIVKNSYPHDPQAFTQGLFYHNGFLYESTGLNGKSSIRKVKLETGKVLMKKDLPSEYFGEGIVAVDKHIIGITWTSQTGFVFDLNSFEQKQKFSYPGEGWGICNNADGQLLMSDGAPFIRVIDPKTLKEVRRFQVTAEGKPLPNLNELEWVDGQLFANVWGSDVIARIDPVSGNVAGWIDLAGLLDARWKGIRTVDVLNGIAWDGKHHRLFVTGKLWPRLFEIELVPLLKR